VTDRAVYAALALLLVGLCLIAMAGLHREHYKGRKWQMLEARVNVLEKIIGGEHD
jgi:hypothetical protein